VSSLAPGPVRASIWSAGCALLLLAACATAPAPQGDQSAGQGPVREFQLSGRLALRQPERSDLLQIEWRHRADQDRIALSTPLGSQVMLLEEAPGHVRLSLPDRAPVEATSDQALMREMVGYTLPVQGLAEWVVGRVPDNAATRSEGEGADRVLSFRDNGWTGSLQRWRAVGAGDLPGLVSVAHDQLQLRLVVDQWQVSRGEP
jgi:outer membrane lipoprotein LolB